MARNPFETAARIQAGGWSASFEGTRSGRLFQDWVTGALHPDREIRWALRELRARARDLVRNNDYAAGIVEAFADNVIGADGIRLKPCVTDPLDEPMREVNWAIEQAWTDWGEPENASVDGQASWLELQRLLIATWVTDGEVFVRHRKGWPNAYGYAIELIDADLLDETFNVPPDANGIEIRMGVELDAFGRRRAYHFSRFHPSERYGSERVRIAADDVVHFFVRRRIGQTRGYSLFAPVLSTIKMIDGLTEAELVASRMAAATMGFITNMDPAAIAAYADRLRIQNDKGTPAKRYEVAPGQIPELAPGQEFEGFDPTHPSSAFEAFLKVMLRGVARAFGVSYLTLTGDVGEANYSSMRAGLLPERDHWRILQRITASRLHRPVYRTWLGTSLLSGAIELPTSVAADYQRVEWRGRGWKWVDPLNDLEAAELEIKLGANSRQRVASEQGRDFEVIVDELKDEEAYANEQGVDVSVRKEAPSPFLAPRPNGDTQKNGSGPANRVDAIKNGRNHG